MARRPCALGSGLIDAISFFHRTMRRAFTPHTGCASRPKRSDLNGIAISNVQPCGNRAVRASHTVFQSRFMSRSSVM
jgi:hypothetical protein